MSVYSKDLVLKYADPKDITDKSNLLNKWKFLAPRSPIAGQTDFSKPVGFLLRWQYKNCSSGYLLYGIFSLVLYAADSKEEVEAFKTYLYTKTVRFLLLQCVVSQDITREKYRFCTGSG